MSALRGSRNAADFSTAIAASQSSAISAFLPAANSGSSFAQSASGEATVIVQIGHSSDAGFASAICSGPRDHSPAAVCRSEGPIVYAATPATSAPRIAATAIERIILVRLPKDASVAIVSSPRQKCLGLLHLLPLDV